MQGRLYISLSLRTSRWSRFEVFDFDNLVIQRPLDDTHDDSWREDWFWYLIPRALSDDETESGGEQCPMCLLRIQPFAITEIFEVAKISYYLELMLRSLQPVSSLFQGKFDC